MLKKPAVISILLFSLQIAGNAFAYLQFEAFYPVSKMGEKNTETQICERHSFNLGEKPYLYILLPDQEFPYFKSDVYTDWLLGYEQKDDEDILTYNTNELEFWLSSDRWFDIEHAGTWNIDGAFAIKNLMTGETISGSGSTYFTVDAAPEPVSTVLFVAGGVPLIAKILQKKRQKRSNCFTI